MKTPTHLIQTATGLRPLRIAFGKGRGFRESIDFCKTNKTAEFFHFLEGKIPVYFDRLNNVQLLKVRNKDLPWLLRDGHVDVGIGGSVWFDEFNCSSLQPFIKLPLKKCRLSLITAGKKNLCDIKMVCTKFQNITRTYLAEKDINAGILAMEGCQETALYLGITDAISDIIETGETIKRMAFTELETMKVVSHGIWIKQDSASIAEQLRDYLILSEIATPIANNGITYP